MTQMTIMDLYQVPSKSNLVWNSSFRRVCCFFNCSWEEILSRNSQNIYDFYSFIRGRQETKRLHESRHQVHRILRQRRKLISIPVLFRLQRAYSQEFSSRYPGKHSALESAVCIFSSYFTDVFNCVAGNFACIS